MRPASGDGGTIEGASGSSAPNDTTVLVLVAPLTSGGAPRAPRTLWWHDGMFAIAGNPPARPATSLLGGCATNDACAAMARAVIGIEDEAGMLVWVELPPDVHPDGSTAEALDGVLDRIGCSARMAVPGKAEALLGGALDAAGDPVPSKPEPGAARLVRAQVPDAHPIFADTPIVPIQVWQPLQARRVRYFYKPPPKPTP